jgi:hypothetical protein
MSIQATVILDSGCFLQMPPPEENIPKGTEIGHFLSGKMVPDIRVRADGNDIKAAALEDIGKKCMIEVRHVRADSSVNREGVRPAPNFHENLLHMKDLYGKDIPVDRGKFDCIFRFEAGLFCAALIKPRTFKELKKNRENGRFESQSADKPKKMKRPILHNVFILFTLEEGDAIQIVKNGKVIWSSKKSRAKNRLDIEVVAENATADKFYRTALQGERESYWMPNQGDPPPVCSQPPCEP